MSRIRTLSAQVRVLLAVWSAALLALLLGSSHAFAAAVITNNDLLPFQGILTDNMPVIFGGFVALAVVAGGYGLALRAVSSFKRLRAPRV